MSLVLSRRRVLLGSGLALAAESRWLRAASALGLSSPAVCRTSAEQEVGPYYVADELLRTSIAEGRPGVPLSVRFVVLDQRTCRPLSGAAIDLWHCDAKGIYSGYTKIDPTGMPGGGGPPPGPPPGESFDPSHPGNRPGPPEGFGPPPPMRPTDHETFLRGIQITSAAGTADFSTIFPGFYMGRTNHIHFKVRVGGHPGQQTYAGGHTSHVGQVFFPEDLAATLMQHEPYSSHAIHRTTQVEDGIFQRQGGAQNIASILPVHSGEAMSFRAELVVAVDPTATPKAVGAGPPPPPA